MMKILLYGNSLALTGLAACLQAVEGVAVTQSSDPKGLAEHPRSEAERGEDPSGLPDIVVVDMAHWSSPVARCCVQRNLRLIGIDADDDTVTVFWGKSFPASSMQEVAQLLANLCRASP